MTLSSHTYNAHSGLTPSALRQSATIANTHTHMSTAVGISDSAAHMYVSVATITSCACMGHAAEGYTYDPPMH